MIRGALGAKCVRGLNSHLKLPGNTFAGDLADWVSIVERADGGGAGCGGGRPLGTGSKGSWDWLRQSTQATLSRLSTLLWRDQVPCPCICNALKANLIFMYGFPRTTHILVQSLGLYANKQCKYLRLCQLKIVDDFFAHHYQPCPTNLFTYSRTSKQNLTLQLQV